MTEAEIRARVLLHEPAFVLLLPQYLRDDPSPDALLEYLREVRPAGTPEVVALIHSLLEWRAAARAAA